MAGPQTSRLTAPADPAGQLVSARTAFLELGGEAAVPIAQRIEDLSRLDAFRVMATASQAARPQWAGLSDDLFTRPLLQSARTGLSNALVSTLRGDSLYRNVFFCFTDAVLLWHYGYTRERTGAARLETVYSTLLRLLEGADRFLEVSPGPEPGTAFFHALRRIRLTLEDAYPLLRRAARLLGSVEAGLATGQKLRPVRGSMLTSYAQFSAQVIAMSQALRAGRGAIGRADVLTGVLAFVRLVETAPQRLTATPSA
jgi:hypothetical protein